MYTNDEFTETYEKCGFTQDGTPHGFIFDDFNELSPSVQKIVEKCHKSTMSSPLQYCRMLQEDAKGQHYMDLVDAERYLINEF
jgi:hypothetical protein